MSEEPKYETYFDETMQDLFLDMKSIQEKFELKRINSIILLKALLEEKTVFCMISYVQQQLARIHIKI